MDINKVLFFKPGAIGDLLHTLPALRALKTNYPAAHVTLVVSPGMESLLQGTSIADRILVFDKTKFKKSMVELVKYGLQLRDEHYDLFIDMQPSFRSYMLRKLSNPGSELVYRKQKDSRIRGRLHAVNNFMETLRPLGIDGSVEEIQLPVNPEALGVIDRFLMEHSIDSARPLVALNCSVGAARPARNWFPDRFAALADRLRDELGVDVVFVGGSEDTALVQRVMAEMKGKSLSAAGVLSIAQSAALLSRCSCLVSSDTGPLHLATAVRTPVVGLYGSTDPNRTGPVGTKNQVIMNGLSCVPCEEKHCPLGTRACMAAITVDEVLDAVRKVVL